MERTHSIAAPPHPHPASHTLLLRRLCPTQVPHRWWRSAPARSVWGRDHDHHHHQQQEEEEDCWWLDAAMLGSTHGCRGRLDTVGWRQRGRRRL